MDYVLSTDKLVKRYGQAKALDGLSMHVPKGAIYGIVGRNGAGKTTLIRLICGLQRPTSGTYSIYGREFTSRDIALSRRRMGAVVETPSIYLDMSARENLRQQYRVLGLPSFEGIDELLALVGLADTGKKKARNFSLGMKQRLGIAVALCGGPDFLILDEPVNGLDPEATRAMRLALVRLNHEHGVTIMISSHVLDQLDRVATRFGVIADGRLAAEFTDEELHDRCGSSVRVRLAEPERGLALLEQELPAATMRVEPDGAITITGASADEVSRAIFAAGLEVRELATVERDIEEYFVELMGATDGEQGGGRR